MSSRPTRTSRLAITSLVLGILGFVCCGLGIPAVICWHIARGKIRESHGRLGGGGLAKAGFILGCLSLAANLIAGVSLPWISSTVTEGRLTKQLSDIRQIHAAVTTMALDRQTTGDNTIGYPADAGIKSVAELKSCLVAKGYISQAEVDRMGFEKYLIGNVSESDPAMTVFIKLRPTDGHSSVILFKGGDGAIVTGSTPAPEGTDPPRDPAYLAP